MKIKKFLSLTEKLVTSALVVMASIYISDLYIPERLYPEVLQKPGISVNARNIEATVSENISFLNKEFNNYYDNIKVQHRFSYSLAEKIFDYPNEAHAKYFFNFINFPILILEQNYNDIKKMKSKLNELKSKDKSETVAYLNTVPENKTLEVFSNPYLNSTQLEYGVFLDFDFFHEAAHNYLYRYQSSSLQEIKTTLKKVNIKPAMEVPLYGYFGRLWSENACDVMGLLLTIKKHQLDRTSALDLVESQLTARAASQHFIKSFNLSDPHETSYAIFLLKQYLQTHPSQEVNQLSATQMSNLALNFAKANVVAIYVKKNHAGDRVRADLLKLAPDIFSSNDRESVNDLLDTNAFNQVVERKFGLIKALK